MLGYAVVGAVASSVARLAAAPRHQSRRESELAGAPDARRSPRRATTSRRPVVPLTGSTL